MDKVIDIKALSIYSDQETIVQALSLSLVWGKPVTILGETGSGKSLLVQAIMGALPKGLEMEGNISLFGQSGLSQRQIEEHWGNDIAMLPQEPWLSLDPIMPAIKQISLVNWLVRGFAKEKSRKVADQALSLLGLDDSLQKVPSHLSGGMAQRLAYLCATAAGGRVLIADEPTKGLDASRRAQLIELLKKHSEFGALLTITHDVEVARSLGGELIVMRQGEILERGDCEAVLTNPKSTYAQELLSAWDFRAPSSTRSLAKQNLVQVKSVSKSRGGKTLFDGLSLTIKAGEVVGIVGDSGLGKSTLADMILGLTDTDSGSITRSEKFAPAKLLKLYQDPPSAFCQTITLEQNLRDLCGLHKIDFSKVSELMKDLKLDNTLLNRTPDCVSGGELQRFAIVRVLLMKPKLLVADEPTSRLDPIIAASTIKLLLEQTRRIDCALVLISHDLKLIDQVSDKVIQLADFAPPHLLDAEPMQTVTVS
ncbi:ABC transporter ATP-binding protein [Vibrio superstes]|uniref:ABC transporter ATP-binding protein n=1 Tax=Vibrio superstes NBRC 103154 TaxID=1219062 RepID=A0A511QUI5_9VIBR|nr:ATP-binding cassette domain-containing protein [Vibrio superstes]GEM80466.1 ABC transporter ATP-binding protein [Vibrio superstes NBRC 103154]